MSHDAVPLLTLWLFFLSQYLKLHLTDHYIRSVKLVGMVTRRIAATIILLSLGVVVLYGMFSGTRLEDYVARNQDEEQIINLVASFHKASMTRDLPRYLACLADGGSFMFSGSMMVSKDTLESYLPQFWSKLDSGDMRVRPNSRESLNGNSLKGSLYDPSIIVKGEEAELVVTFVTPILRWKTKLFLELRKSHGQWLIQRLAWAMG